MISSAMLIVMIVALSLLQNKPGLKSYQSCAVACVFSYNGAIFMQAQRQWLGLATAVSFSVYRSAVCFVWLSVPSGVIGHNNTATVNTRFSLVGS